MPEKFKNKYRVTSPRLQNWDYGWNGKYFITVCTKDRVHFFGEIITAQQEMVLSETGKIVLKIWNEIPVHFPFILLDEFVIMPNHIHGIVIIKKPWEKTAIDDHCRGAINRPSTMIKTDEPSKKTGGATGNKNPILHDNLSRVIRWLKGRITFEAHKINKEFNWQPEFYEHVIKDENSYFRIKSYIRNNPQNWKTDKLR